MKLSNTCAFCGKDVRKSRKDVVLQGEMLFCNSYCHSKEDFWRRKCEIREEMVSKMVCDLTQQPLGE